MEAVLAALSPLVAVWAGEYGWLAQVIGVMGTARLILKPLQPLILAVVKATPTPKDNALYQKVMDHKAMQIFLYALDWGASIKVKSKENVE